jgi:hypothetical protein
VESGCGGDRSLIVVKTMAAFGDGGVEVIYGVEVFVDEGLVDQGPEVLGGLQFGAVSGLIEVLMASGMPRPIPVGSTCGLAARRTGRGDQATGSRSRTSIGQPCSVSARAGGNQDGRIGGGELRDPPHYGRTFGLSHLASLAHTKRDRPFSSPVSCRANRRIGQVRQ